MNYNFEIDGKRLRTENFEIKFNYDIAEVKFSDDIYVVLLLIPNEVNEIDNIFGVNIKGEIVWRIENPSKVFPKRKLGRAEFDNLSSSIYVNMNLGVDGIFTANTFFANKYSFDHKTGKLLKKEVGRW